MNKKGFTLIELLAVIIILAIIALIATPMVLDVIEDTKVSALKSEVKMIADAVNNYCATAEMKRQMDGTTSICSDGVTVEEVGQMSNLNNTVVENITYENGRVTSLTITKNGRTSNYDGTDVIIGDNAPVETPSYVCKRATELHTETCNQTSGYCNNAGYATGATITYGNAKALGTTLASGDAFDCDVNGDGNYDATTERFYYVTDLDTNTAVLIYYNNVSGGEAGDSITNAYNIDTSSYLGPETAIQELPSIMQWTNVSLTNTTRNITDEDGTVRVSNFDYTYEGVARAARLLTYQEISAVCSSPYLYNCHYLTENTKYSSDSFQTSCYWLENYTDYTNYAWIVSSTSNKMNNSIVDYTGHGVRPAIEVPKANIQY